MACAPKMNSRPPRSPDFTVEQATDLARYFLSPGWKAVITPGGSYKLQYVAISFSGSTWRAAFRAAGVDLPYRPRFSSVERKVVRGDDVVAVCQSNSFAERMANALNAYEPDSRGK